MKKITLFIFTFCGLLLVACSSQKEQEQKKEEKKESTSTPIQGKLDKHNVSYALGYNVGDILAETDKELYLEDLVSGINDAFLGTDSPRMQDEEIKKTLILYNVEISEKMKEKHQLLMQDNIAKGKEFVAQYDKNQGVHKHPSGFSFKVLQEGEGRTPQQDDDVMVDYVGKKIDGTVFFSTKDHGQPANFSVSNVIKGWTIALQEMPEGSVWEIVVPPELAYGDKGIADIIGPGETLIFEMNLLGIQDQDQEGDSVN